MSTRLTLRLVALSPLLLGACNEFEISVPEFAEVFTQSPWEKVDVLLVVDNSCSMDPYQDKLATDFGGFFEYFDEGEVDWQLAVTHTDANAFDFGRVRGSVVTPDLPNPEATFAELVRVGATGGGLEAGLEAADRMLNRGGDGFPRQDASTSVIFVSDEEDTSPLTVADYVNSFYAFHGDRFRQAFNASALTVESLADCTPEQFVSSSLGTRYIEAAELTGGITANLCVDDFEPIVRDLALTTSAVLDTFFLKERPDLNTLVVSLDGERVACDAGVWSYDVVELEGVPRPAIRFAPDAIPAPGEGILVEYRRGTGLPDDFCAPGAPDDEPTEVPQ